MFKKITAAVTILLVFSVISGRAYCAQVAGARTITITDGISKVLQDARLIKIELAGKDISFEDTLAALSALLPHLNIIINKTYNQFFHNNSVVGYEPFNYKFSF